MHGVAETIRRALDLPRFFGHRSGEAHAGVIMDPVALPRTAALMAHFGGGSATVIHRVLRDLWELDTTALYVQLAGLSSGAELVITPHAGHNVVAAGDDFRVEATTGEPAPNGAYLVERQYRQLGPFENPPLERALVLVRITAGSGRRYRVDVPHWVSHLSVVAQRRIVVSAAPVSRTGEMRYPLNPAGGGARAPHDRWVRQMGLQGID